MRLRVHCDEMAYGGAPRGVSHVDAVDHCNFITGEDVNAIAERGIVVVACPATIAFLICRSARRSARCSKRAPGRTGQRLQSGTSPCFNCKPWPTSAAISSD